jgi:hypothetical protein
MARKHTPERSSASSARESSLFIVVEGEGAVVSEGRTERSLGWNHRLLGGRRTPRDSH